MRTIEAQLEGRRFSDALGVLHFHHLQARGLRDGSMGLSLEQISMHLRVACVCCFLWID